MRKVFVKYACKCANCGRELVVGQPGYFEIITRKMFCESCGEAEQPEPTAKPRAQDAPEEKSSRDQRIEQAHQDNMRANAVLVEAIHKLAAEVGWLAEKIKFPPQPPVVKE